MAVAISAREQIVAFVIRALASGRPVAAQRKLVTRFALICMAVSGCFYADPINQRPSLDIRQTSGDVAYRGDTIKLLAISDDPEGHFVWFRWRVYLCNEEHCAGAPFYEKSADVAEFVVPLVDDDAMPVRSLRVVLHGEDDYGATARPEQELVIAIADRAPTLDLGKDSRYGYVVSTPINVYAKVGDPDDGPSDPQLEWRVYTPTNQPAYDFIDLSVEPDPDDPHHVVYGKTFTPKGIGDWTIEVVATDRLGETTKQTLMLKVGTDNPPCLRTLSPVVAQSPAALPMSEPTLFQVHVVTDDLDPYPTVNDAVLGTTQFTWSVLAPGGSRQPLPAVTGNRLALDPASYQLGDIVEVRVEIADRNLTSITCADGIASCSVIADNNCLQRQTWRVEVR